MNFQKRGHVTVDWQDQAFIAAKLMLVDLRWPRGQTPRSRPGQLGALLRRLPASQRKPAADEIRIWLARYFGPLKIDTATLADELLGVDVVTIIAPDSLARRMPGRSRGVGVDVAVAAVRARVQAGASKRAACREVADTMRAFWRSHRVDLRPATDEELEALHAHRLERVLKDASRVNSRGEEAASAD